jgi:hypothetical protein
VNARIRAGSRLKRFLCFILIGARCLRLPSWVLVPQIEDHWVIWPSFFCQMDIKLKRLELEVSSSSKLRMCMYSYILSPDIVLWIKGTLYTSVADTVTRVFNENLRLHSQERRELFAEQNRNQSCENLAVLAGSSRSAVWDSERNQPQFEDLNFSLLALSNRAHPESYASPQRRAVVARWMFQNYLSTTDAI